MTLFKQKLHLNKLNKATIESTLFSVADPEICPRGGPMTRETLRPTAGAIFFLTSFNRAGGRASGPLRSATGFIVKLTVISVYLQHFNISDKNKQAMGVSLLGRRSIYFLKLLRKEHLIKTCFKELEKHLTRSN